jgi:hypothetical protein
MSENYQHKELERSLVPNCIEVVEEAGFYSGSDLNGRFLGQSNSSPRFFNDELKQKVNEADNESFYFARLLYSLSSR